MSMDTSTCMRRYRSLCTCPCTFYTHAHADVDTHVDTYVDTHVHTQTGETELGAARRQLRSQGGAAARFRSPGCGAIGSATKARFVCADTAWTCGSTCV